MTEPTAASQPEAGYPVSLNIARPDRQSRLTNFPLFIGMLMRLLVLIPHFIVLYFSQLVMCIVYFVATFAILFTAFSYQPTAFSFVG